MTQQAAHSYKPELNIIRDEKDEVLKNTYSTSVEGQNLSPVWE